MRSIFISIIVLLQIPLIAQTQISFLNKAYEELDKRGISEEELRVKLEGRGIILEDLKKMDPSEAIHYQTEIEGAIKEIESEKSRSPKSKVPSAIDNNLDKSKKDIDEDSPSKIKEKISLDQRANDSMKILIRDSFKDVEIWGQHIFKNKSLSLYESSKDVKAPSSYVLGVGDQITIAIWGVSQLNEVYEINSEGYIAPARMPRIFLKGSTLGRAKGMLSNYFRRFYRFDANQFDVNLSSSRTIQVNIVGEVEHFGSFTLPAINTVFNALVAAGGPNKIGSVRKINLIRNGKTKVFDVYKFIMNPSSVGDASIENNDYIQVPISGKLVKINGAINRPYKYELIDGEELNSLIYYAGGLKGEAITKTIQIQRIDNDKKIILDVPYKELISSKGDFKLRNGDIVTVFTVKTGDEDFVFTKGELRSESAYQYKEGMTLGDLVKKLDFTYESDLKNAFLKRNNPDKTTNVIRVNLINVRKGMAEAQTLLKPQDELEIIKLSTFTDKSYISISGAVRNSGRFALNVKEDLRVKDLILLSGGLKSNTWDYAYLFRTENGSRKDQIVIKLPVNEIMDNETSDKNIFIMPFDSLVVLSGKQFSEYSYIEISGAVRKPGKYQFSKMLNLKDAVTLAEGFSFSAASNKIDIYRIEIIDNQPTKTIVKSIVSSKDLMVTDASSEFILEPFDLVVIRSQPNFEMQKIVYIEGEVLYPGPYAIIDVNEKITDIIKRSGGLTSEAFAEGATLNRSLDDIGYIVMDLPDAMKTYKSRNNILVKDKDYINIPKRKDFVRISGETNASLLYPEKLLSSNNSINVAYFEGKKAIFYIRNYAAGLNDNADPKKITVEHANGRIESTKRGLFGRIYPNVYKGSIINVGAKDAKKIEAKKDKKDIDWGKVVADSIAQATGVLSLILLIERLN
ncbi:MAG: SLBB domain-containing protein [Saprospiraceae bacterium]